MIWFAFVYLALGAVISGAVLDDEIAEASSVQFLVTFFLWPLLPLMYAGYRLRQAWDRRQRERVRTALAARHRAEGRG